MRRARTLVHGAIVLIAGLCARKASADEVPPERRAFVEITTGRDTVFVGEPIALRLRFGLDATWFAEHAVPLVRQPMDLPVQVIAPAMTGLAGAVRRPPLPEVPAPPPRKRFVLNDGPGLAGNAPDAERDGRRFSVQDVEIAFLPTQPGVLVVPPPTLRFAYATRFERDFAGRRLPADRTDVRIAGTAPTIRVVPLPEEGRPAGFSGAVGRFTIRAALDPSPPAGTKGLRLVLRIAGEGNLEAFGTPSLEGLSGFHVYGALDDRGRGVRTIRYDLAPVEGGLTEVPPISLATFDPEPPGGYRTVTTGAALRLAAPLPAAVPAPPQSPGTDTEGDAAGRGGSLGGARGALLAGAVAAVLAALGYGLLRRRRARAAAEADPVRVRLRRAVEALRAGTSRPGTYPSDAFAEVLAARLSCPTAAVIAPDLAGRLVAAGVAHATAARASAALERLVAARYGGAATSAVPEDLVALAERIASATEAHGSPSTGG